METGIVNFKGICKTAWLITNSLSGIVGMTNDAPLVLVKFLSFLILFFTLKIVIVRKTEKIYTCSGTTAQ